MLFGDMIRNSYVLRRGAISPYGVIAILYQRVPESGDPREGLKLYSPVLHAHANGTCRAKIVGNTVQIVNGAGRVVATLEEQDLIVVDFQTEVSPTQSGYLPYATSLKGEVEALDRAASGIKPPYCDNSPFTRVDPKWAGTTLVHLQLRGCRDAAVFTKEGTSIPCTVDRPLAFKRWGEVFVSSPPELPFGED